jgi:hypothetical protein
LNYKAYNRKHWLLFLSDNKEIIEFSVLYTLDEITKLGASGCTEVGIPIIGLTSKAPNLLKAQQLAWDLICEYIKSKYQKEYDVAHQRVTIAWQHETNNIKFNVPTREKIYVSPIDTSFPKHLRA